MLKDNADLKSTLKKYDLAQKEFLKIKGHDQELNAWILKSTNFFHTFSQTYIKGVA